MYPSLVEITSQAQNYSDYLLPWKSAPFAATLCSFVIFLIRGSREGSSVELIFFSTKLVNYLRDRYLR